MSLTWQQSIGIKDDHLIDLNDALGKSFLIHKDVKESLSGLFDHAKSDNIPIAIISSHRTFDQQLTIWNDKWQGYRPVYSRHGRPLNIGAMSDMEKYKAIALWSALPGLSRHHWGTDIDVFSAAAIEKGYHVELQPEEFEKGGACEKLDQWINENLVQYGFFRPYEKYQQGVSEEPWHISHVATSKKIIEGFLYDQCKQQIEKSDIQSSSFIANRFDHYCKSYFKNICAYPVISENHHE